jgi:hypothetical protein
MRNNKFWLNVGLASLVILVIGGYSLFQARKLIEGPEISIISPLNGATVMDSLVDITGVAKNINEISVNDRPILIDEQGNFKEKLLLYPGYNIIKLRAKDKFGKEVEKEIQNVYINN